MRQTKLFEKDIEHLGFKLYDVVVLKNPREWEKDIKFMVTGFSSGGMVQGNNVNNKNSFYSFKPEDLIKVGVIE